PEPSSRRGGRDPRSVSANFSQLETLGFGSAAQALDHGHYGQSLSHLVVTTYSSTRVGGLFARNRCRAGKGRCHGATLRNSLGPARIGTGIPGSVCLVS